MSTTIKNVAIAGASGALGSVVFQKLVSSGSFNVTVLRRQGSSAVFPSGTDIRDVDFDSVDSLKSALAGQDAVVATLGSTSLGFQKNLVDAAIAAGVQRFIPSEFGSDLDNPRTRKLPVFAPKVEIREYLEEKAESTPLTYTYVCNSAFLDWGLQYDFILKISDYKPTIFDGGDRVFSATTLATVGDAVAGILLRAEETSNRTVYIESAKLSQNRLLALAKRVAPGKPWEPQPAKLDDITATADARLAQKLFDAETFVPYLFRSILDPAYGGNFEKTDNELLGLKEETEQDILDILQKLIVN